MDAIRSKVSNSKTVPLKWVVDYDFTFITLVSVCCCLSINNICKVTTLKVQSKGRYFHEIAFQGLQQTAGRDYMTFLPG